MKYKVTGITSVYWDVVVDAEDEEEAMDMAEDMAFEDSFYYQSNQVNIGNREVDDSEILEVIE